MVKFGVWPGALLLLLLVGALLPVAFTIAQQADSDNEDSQRAGTAQGSLQPATVSDESGLPKQPETGLASDTHLDKTPPRFTTGLDLTKMGWTYDCRECHDLFDAQWRRDFDLVEHDDIVLNHGNNRFCLNCHNEKNVGVFADYDGAVISEKDVVMLCAKCHGPKYRDWKAGVHGRKNGYWDTDKGPQTRLRCIQCHDPHFPKYHAIHPLPAPNYPLRAAGAEHARKLAEEHSGKKETDHK